MYFVFSSVRSTPTAALETILNLTPMDLKIKEIAGRNAIRLKCTGSFTERTYNHGNIIRELGGFDFSNIDLLCTTFSRNANFSITFPSREE